MPARLTAHLPEAAAVAWLVGDGDRARIGRGGASTLRLEHASVSREHAELARVDGRWRLRDLGSKNGTHYDGAAVGDAPLADRGWLRFGDIYCEFEAIDADDAAAIARVARDRRTRATALTRGIGQAGGFGDLLGDSLRAAVELARCERGFLLLQDGTDLRVGACHGVDPGRGAAAFDGSVGAVARVLRQRKPVVANDIGALPWLAQRASVVDGGLSALVCVPLLDAGDPLGVIYVDRRGDAGPVDALDLELLEAFAERAAVYIAARRASDALATRALPAWQAAGEATLPKVAGG